MTGAFLVLGAALTAAEPNVGHDVLFDGFDATKGVEVWEWGTFKGVRFAPSESGMLWADFAPVKTAPQGPWTVYLDARNNRRDAAKFEIVLRFADGRTEKTACTLEGTGWRTFTAKGDAKLAGWNLVAAKGTDILLDCIRIEQAKALAERPKPIRVLQPGTNGVFCTEYADGARFACELCTTGGETWVELRLGTNRFYDVTTYSGRFTKNAMTKWLHVDRRPVRIVTDQPIDGVKARPVQPDPREKFAVFDRIDMKGDWCSIGTSISWYNDNVGNAGGRFTRGYQDRVRDVLLFPRLINLGISGGTSGSHASWRSFPKARYYTIEHGINDWGQKVPVGTFDQYKANAATNTFYANYRKIIETVRKANSDAKIILCTPRKAYGFGTYLPKHADAAKDGVYLKDYAEAVRRIAAEEKLPVADFFATCGEHDELKGLSIDVALHPNDPGYQRMADELIRAFKGCR